MRWKPNVAVLTVVTSFPTFQLLERSNDRSLNPTYKTYLGSLAPMAPPKALGQGLKR